MGQLHSEVNGWRKWLAFARNRCPRCGQGRIFAGQFAMNDPCPVCGLIFQREEGYFLGSMYFGYLFGCMFIGGGFFFLSWLLPTWNDYAIVGIVVAVYLLLIPFVFRRSRSAWIYFDRWGCLGDTSAGAYEKAAMLHSSSYQTPQTEVNYYALTDKNNEVARLAKVVTNKDGVFGYLMEEGRWIEERVIIQRLSDPSFGDAIDENEARRLASKFNGAL